MQTYPNSVMLTCRDMKKSVAFYRDVLGFELSEVFPNEAEPQWANLVFGGQSVMLGEAMESFDEAQCSTDREDLTALWKERVDAFNNNASGVGMAAYLFVEDVDGYYDAIKGRGAEPRTSPADQFYGIRDFAVVDPDGYHFVFYKPIQMATCQSCGMPLADAEPGQMYCGHCTDDAGNLRSYDEVFEGTVIGFFMGMQKMDRASAEAAAQEHLAKMPAWVARS